MSYSREDILETLNADKGILSKWVSDLTEKAKQTYHPPELPIYIAAIRALHEFLQVSLTYAETLSHTHAILESIKPHVWINIKNQSDHLIYTQFMTGIENSLAIFNKIELIKTTCQQTTLAEGLAQLTKIISTTKFERFIDATKLMIHDHNKIAKMYANDQKTWDTYSKPLSSKLGFLTFSDMRSCFTLPFQYVTRMSLMAKEIEIRFNKGCEQNIVDLHHIKTDSRQLLSLTTTMAEQANQEMKVVEHLSESPTQLHEEYSRLKWNKKKHATRIVCEAILALNINNPLVTQNTNKILITNFNAFVSSILTIRKFAPKSTYEELRLALGYDLLVSETPYDPTKFNPRQLDTIFKNTRDPFFLVLITTIPISDTFTPAQKIKAYIDIARQYYEGNITPTKKYLGAYRMAQAAYAIAKLYPSDENIHLVQEAFSPQHTELSVSQQCDLNQFGQWILRKSMKYQNEINMSSLEAQRPLDTSTSITSDSGNELSPDDLSTFDKPSVLEDSNYLTICSSLTEDEQDGLQSDSPQSTSSPSSTSYSSHFFQPITTSSTSSSPEFELNETSEEEEDLKLQSGKK